MAERLFDIDSVAELLSLSRSTVYRLISTHELGHVRVAHKIRVPESEVDKLIRKGTTDAEAHPGQGSNGTGREAGR